MMMFGSKSYENERKRVVFIRKGDNQTLTAYLQGSNDENQREIFKYMVLLAWLGVATDYGRVHVFPNHWRNGAFIKVDIQQ